MYPTDNLTARVYSIHADIVRRAAQAAGKSVSEYVAEVIVPWAASDLGETLPPLPRNDRLRHKTMVEKAAKAAGMSRAKFERHAADVLSAQVLGLPTPDEALAPGRPPTVPPPSGERPVLRVGGYARASGEVTATRRRRSA